MECIIKNNPDELMHYGVLGMKWGVRKRTGDGEIHIRKSRKYYNKDGSLNTSGQQLVAKKQYKLDKKTATNSREKVSLELNTIKQ